MSTRTMQIGPEDSVRIRQVGGDLTLQGWDRNELEARGDQVRIQKEDASVSVAGGGDLVISVPAGARLSITNIGGDVRLEKLSGAVELGLIGGDAELHDLSGPVRISGPLGGEVHMENVTNISMGFAGVGMDSDLGEKVRRTVLKATQRAEKKIRRAQVKWQKAEGGLWGYNSDPDFSSQPRTAEPVSEEERMTILRMLQEKKITSEEAEKLLSALEGNA